MSLPPFGHGVAGVERQIEDRGGQLIGVDGGDAGFVLEHRFDLDMLAERRPQQLGGVDDQRVDVDLARLQRLLAGEREQMLGEIRAACGGVVDHPGDGRELRLLLDRVRQDLDGSGDDRQDIVEIMRDAAGELAEGFHLSRTAGSGPPPRSCR